MKDLLNSPDIERLHVSQPRRVLRNSIVALVIPALEERGFRLSSKGRGDAPMWFMHRKRADSGYDVIDINMARGTKPQFDATINVVPAQGVIRPWSHDIKAEDAVACDLLERVVIARLAIRHQVLRALARWLGIGWFGFKASSDPKLTTEAAAQACMKFISVLPQADLWWVDGTMGEDLIIERIEVYHK